MSSSTQAIAKDDKIEVARINDTAMSGAQVEIAKDDGFEVVASDPNGSEEDQSLRVTDVAETQKLASDSEPETIVDSDVEILVISMGANAERKSMLWEDSRSKVQRMQEIQRAIDAKKRKVFSQPLSMEERMHIRRQMF